MTNITRVPWYMRLARAIVIYLAIIAATLIVIYAVLCIPRHIRREFSGIEVRMGQQHELLQTTDIIIDGWLRNRPFSYPEFEGEFSISAYPQVNSDKVLMPFSKEFTNGSLNYIGTGNVSLLGAVFTDAKFSSVAIQMFETEKSAGGAMMGTIEDRVIVAPATNLAEANDVLSERHMFWMQDFTGILYHWAR